MAGMVTQTTAGKRDDYPGIKIVQLNDFMLLTFPVENELSDGRN